MHDYRVIVLLFFVKYVTFRVMTVIKFFKHTHITVKLATRKMTHIKYKLIDMYM